MKIRPVGAELFRVVPSGRSEITKQVMVLRKFSKAPKNIATSLYLECGDGTWQTSAASSNGKKHPQYLSQMEW
jgi:hypothetical protein